MKVSLHPFIVDLSLYERYAVSTQSLYELPNTVEILTALVNFFEKLALVPDAPSPLFPYSPNSTLSVLASPLFQIAQPALLITLLKFEFWNTTRA